MGSKVTAALPWWNELPEDLERCVRSLAAIADKVVALDGAYVRYPGATTRSDPEQVEAIKRGAEAAGLQCEIIQPDKLWAGQCEKRSRLLELASWGSDWIVTVDADHVVSADRLAARRFMDRNPHIDVISVPYWTPINNERSMDESSVGAWHASQARDIQIIPHIWRVLPGMRVERFHWWYSAIKNDRRVWLWGGDDAYAHAVITQLPSAYQVKHLTLMRTKEQIEASRAFLNDRQKIVLKTGQEDALPGMKPPKYDFSRVPW